MSESRRQRKREERIRQILDTAFQIVARDGLDGLTIGRLAKEMDWATGAMYRYFPGKEDLILGLQLDAIGVLGAYLLSCAPATDDPVKDIRSLYLAYLTFPVEHPVQALLIDLVLADPRPLLTAEQATQVNDVIRPLVGEGTSRLARAQEAGCLRAGDPEVRAYQLWGALHGLSGFRKRDALLRPALAGRVLAEGVLDDLLAAWGLSQAVTGD